MTTREATKAGQIIILNGASSSGKSTLARALADTLSQPFLHLSSDHLVASGMLPARRDTSGPFSWPDSVRPRFFDGFHRCIPAFAAAGNNLIVEHVIEFPEWRHSLAHLLETFDVFLIGVHCDLDVLDLRENHRGDRRIGEGRAHIEANRIHHLGPYDLDVDTTKGTTSQLVATIIAAWNDRDPISALQATTPDSTGARSR